MIRLGMSWCESASPLCTCVKVDDCCDPFFVGIVTRVKLIENVCECVFATDCA
jgi:hypothetical protein